MSIITDEDELQALLGEYVEEPPCCDGQRPVVEDYYRFNGSTEFNRDEAHWWNNHREDEPDELELLTDDDGNVLVFVDFS